MTEISFEEIKKALLYNFENCEIINRTIDLQVTFKDKKDAEWFEKNICYPKNLEENEYPISFISSVSPIGDLEHVE